MRLQQYDHFVHINLDLFLPAMLTQVNTHPVVALDRRDGGNTAVLLGYDHPASLQKGGSVCEWPWHVGCYVECLSEVGL